MDDTSLTIKGKAEKTGGKARAEVGDLKSDLDSDKSVRNDTRKPSR